MPFIPHTPGETAEMLKTVGVATFEELFADIPADMRPRSLNLPNGLTEQDALERLEAIAARNDVSLVSFLGAGFYNHHIPAAVDTLSGRGEFSTAYTPYQPEASQGTLQAIFEYQTAVCRLFDMDCANASVYDGGTALFEAVMMAMRLTKRRRIVFDDGVNPIWRKMLVAYTANMDIDILVVPHFSGKPDIDGLRMVLDDTIAAVVVQNPNFFGTISDYSALCGHAREEGVISIMSVYPIMQAVLKTPGDVGADIAVAEGQSLGLPLSFGGPYLGVMACKKGHVRQMPGRIVGRTADLEGRTGYVLTLQAREQHIRRAKATSNICSNQALCALRSLIYMTLLGPEGLKRTAEISMARARYAAERLTALPGVRLLNNAPFGNEFAVRLPFNADAVAGRLAQRGYVPGFPVGRYYPGLENVLLVACTEKTSEEQIGMLAECMKSEFGAESAGGAP